MLKITFIASAETLLKSVNNSIFLTPKAKLAFLQLRQTFIKASILHHFNVNHYI